MGTRLLTAEQLLEMAGSRRFELVRGELVEMTPIGGEHGRIVGLLLLWLLPFVAERKLGLAAPEWGVVLARNPDIVRGPDITFVRGERTGGRVPRGFFEGAPDLAVEVTSPFDRPGEVHEKVQEYLRYGTPLVWLVDTDLRTVTSFRPSTSPHVYRDDEPVTGEEVLPGFSFRPSDLFAD